MKRKLLVLALLITFSISYKEETKAASDFVITSPRVETEPRCPAFIERWYPVLDVMKVHRGQDMMLTIYYSGNPEPSFKLFYGTKEIELKPSKYKLMRYDKQFCLIIKNIQGSDEKEYKILIENEHGEDSMTFKIEMIVD